MRRALRLRGLPVGAWATPTASCYAPVSVLRMEMGGGNIKLAILLAAKNAEKRPHTRALGPARPHKRPGRMGLRVPHVALLRPCE